MSYAVAVDIGGTFTDLVAFDHATGAVVYAKSPTTCDNLVAAILACLAKAQIAAREIPNVSHGTTLVINSLPMSTASMRFWQREVLPAGCS